jgi:hypothetical protein
MTITPGVATSAQSSGTASITTAPITTSAGMLAVATLAWWQPNDTPTSTPMSDSYGNTWFPAITPTLGASGSGSQRATLYYAILNTAGSGHTFTLTCSPGASESIAVQVFSGFLGTPTLDQYSANQPSSGTTLTASAVVTTVADEVIVAGFSHNSGTSPTMTAGASFTIASGGSQAESASHTPIAIESRVVSATGSYAASITLGSSAAGVFAVASFYDAVPATPQKRFVVGRDRIGSSPLRVIGGTSPESTQVGADLQSSWNTRAIAGQNQQSSWNTRATIAQTKQLAWHVRCDRESGQAASVGGSRRHRTNQAASVAHTNYRRSNAAKFVEHTSASVAVEAVSVARSRDHQPR